MTTTEPMNMPAPMMQLLLKNQLESKRNEEKKKAIALESQVKVSNLQ